jgi:hypothetical protein
LWLRHLAGGLPTVENCKNRRRGAGATKALFPAIAELIVISAQSRGSRNPNWGTIFARGKVVLPDKSAEIVH